jgi:hypothetical protein
MRMIADVYNGRAEVPLPDMEREERPAIPNLLQQGVDQMAGRITSVTPQVQFASAKPGIRKADRNAHAASQTVTGWWQSDRVMMKQKQRGRRLIAYGMTPTVLRWDYKEHRPVWHVRHPLESFPSPDVQPGQVRPNDCIFSFKRTFGWMQANGYGQHAAQLVGSHQRPERDGIVTLLEYMDGDHTVLMATGYYSSSDLSYYEDNGNLRGVVLEAYPNLTEQAPVTVPTRLTLDDMTGQFDGMIGMYYQ